MISELLKSIDKGAYYAFSELIKEDPRLAQLLQAGEWVGSYAGAVLLALLACILLIAQTRYRAATLAALAFVIGALGVEVLQSALPTPRPDNAANRIETSEMQRSFPARETFTFTLAGALLVYSAWGILRGWQTRTLMVATVVVLVLWVAMSEIMLVLHFVTDVAAGLFGGLALALLVTRFAAPASRPSMP